MPDYLTAQEVSQILDLHVQYVRRMAQSGKLKADKKNRVWLFYRDSVENYQKAIEGKSKNDPTRGQE